MNRPLKLFISKESQSGIIGYLTDFEYINRNRYSGYIRAYSDTLQATL